MPEVSARDIVRLAVPAFFALVAEPLFLLADSAIIGHVGTAALAGLGVASGALLTAAGIFVFLAYATTAVVGRRLGAGDQAGAVSAGIDGLWLALVLGAASAALVGWWAPGICAALGADGAALVHAVTYLRVSVGGLPAMLLVLAATGVLRGFLDTRTPMVAAIGGFGLNIVLNVWFVLGLGWGIAGSAWGTVIAQWVMAVGLVGLIVRRAMAMRAALRPRPGRIVGAARAGFPLLVRTLALRAALLITTWTVAGSGEVPLAAHQVAMTIWASLAFALDALAIAGQALIGHRLGAGDAAGARAATRRMTRWGVGAGVFLGALTAAASGVIPLAFTPDPQVRAALAASLIVVGVSQVLSGYVFVLDGVLIGAGDAPWLAGAMVISLLVYAPLAIALRQPLTQLTAAHTLMAVWAAWCVFMASRAVGLWWRARSDAWLVTGA